MSYDSCFEHFKQVIDGASGSSRAYSCAVIVEAVLICGHAVPLCHGRDQTCYPMKTPVSSLSMPLMIVMVVAAGHALMVYRGFGRRINLKVHGSQADDPVVRGRVR